MRKKKFILLSILLCLSLCAWCAMIMIGCGGNNGGDSGTGKGDIKSLVGFKDSSVSIEIGSRYTPDMTSVQDKNGYVFKLNEELLITAKNAAGEEVPITNGAFTVADFSGYTVYYRVYEGKNYEERKVSVTVTDTTAPEITIYGWRSEYEVGTFAMPEFYVLDNSGETLSASYKIVDAQTNAVSNSVTVNGSTITFSEPGTYKIVAEATDSKGNKGTAEKEVVITASNGTYVWENFDNARHLEVIKNNNHYTSQTTYKWLSDFNGESGVAMIKPNYKERWYNSAFIQIGFNKTYEDMYACKWDYFIVRAYISAGSENTVGIANGMYSFGSYETGKWVDIKIDRKYYLSESNYNMLSGFVGSETMDERYDAFAKGVTGDAPNLFLSVNTASHDTDVTIYIDEITWGKNEKDVTAPTVTLQGVTWKVKSNTSMKIPTIVVSDDMDPVTSYDGIKFYKVTNSGREEIAIKNGSVAIGAEGKYVLVVSVSDFSGNKADREFTFTALDDYDTKIFATYDSENEIGGVSGTLSYLESFEGATGVMKSVITETASYGVGFLKMQFAQEVIENAIANKFDYIRIRLYVSADTSSEKIAFYSWNRCLGEVKLNTWVDFDITIKDLSNGSFLSYNDQLTRQSTYNKFLNEYVYNMSIMMYMNDTSLINSRGSVTYYIDSIQWGVTYDGDFIDSIEGLKTTFDSSKQDGNKLTVPTTANVSDGITAIEKSLTEFKVYEKNTQTEILPENGVYTFADGLYIAVAKVEGCKDFTMNFVVENLANTIYTFDKDINWSTIVGGLNSLAWDDKYGESTWVEFFEGEHGVQKANNVQSYFTFDIGQTPFTFDYINARVYFESEKSSVNVYCGSNLVAQNVETNKWVTLKITSDMVNNATAYLKTNFSHYPVLDSSSMFADVSWGNQDVFHFDIKDSEGAAVNVTTYLSYVSYDPLTPYSVSFDLKGSGSEIADVTTGQGGRIDSDKIPADPTDDSYSFVGWYLNAECTGDKVDLATYAFSTKTTLYAKWGERDIEKELNLPAEFASGTTLTLFNNKVQGAEICKYGTATALTVTEGKVTLTDAGLYEYKITKTNNDVVSILFNVYDSQYTVHSWATEDTDSTSFNLHLCWAEGGTDWLREFEGEYGVRKTKSTKGEFQFDIGNTPFEFDYVVARVYFEIENVNKIRLYSYWSPICDGDTAVAANAWVDLYIPRSAIQTGGSIFGQNSGRYDSDENFYEDVFGTVGYNNQSAFKFTIYDAENGTPQVSPVVYISSVSYVPVSLAKGETAVYKFDTATDGTLNDGGSAWLLQYKNEYGVRKANSATSNFKFDIGDYDHRFDFDYITARIYLEVADVESVKLVGGKVVVTESLQTNKWVDFVIPKSAVQNAENNAYGDVWYNPSYLADDKFPEIAFVSSYGMFKFNIYKTDSEETVNATVYISCVSYGTDTERANETCKWNFVSSSDDGINTERANLGGSTWLNGYKGEFGVSKSSTASSVLAFSLWNNVVTFDYINIRVYFESEKSSINVYCGNVLVAENVATNQWVTLKIERSMIQNKDSAFYLSRTDLANDTYLSDEKFLSTEIAFSDASWYNQQIFRFTLKDTEGAETNVTSYVSYIDYGVNATEQA